MTDQFPHTPPPQQPPAAQAPGEQAHTPQPEDARAVETVPVMPVPNLPVLELDLNSYDANIDSRVGAGAVAQFQFPVNGQWFVSADELAAGVQIDWAAAQQPQVDEATRAAVLKRTLVSLVRPEDQRRFWTVICEGWTDEEGTHHRALNMSQLTKLMMQIQARFAGPSGDQPAPLGTPPGSAPGQPAVASPPRGGA